MNDRVMRAILPVSPDSDGLLLVLLLLITKNGAVKMFKIVHYIVQRTIAHCSTSSFEHFMTSFPSTANSKPCWIC